MPKDYEMNVSKDHQPEPATVKVPQLAIVPPIEAQVSVVRIEGSAESVDRPDADQAPSEQQSWRDQPPQEPPHEHTRTAILDYGRDGLPAGYIIRRDGIYQLVESGTEQKEVWLCSPMRVAARYRNSANTGWGRLVEVTDSDGKVHQVPIEDQRIASSAGKVIAALVDRGLRYDSPKSVIELLRTWHPLRRMTSVDQLGWSDADCSSFVLGNGRVIGDADVLPNQASLAATASEIKAMGTEAEWREYVGVPCIGNPLLITAVSLAFSGPLLELLGMDSGGGLHFRGSSSCGKSTTVRIAVSVWGSPKVMQSWRATSSGLESVAAASNGTLLALDELAEVSAKNCFEAVYMVSAVLTPPSC